MWAVRCRASDSPHFPSHPSPHQISGESSLGRTRLHTSHPSRYFPKIGTPVVFSYQPRQDEDITAHANVLHYSHER